MSTWGWVGGEGAVPVRRRELCGIGGWDVLTVFVVYLVVAFVFGMVGAGLLGAGGSAGQAGASFETVDGQLLLSAGHVFGIACGVGLVVALRRYGPGAFFGRPSGRLFAIGLGIGVIVLLAKIVVGAAYVGITGDVSNPQAALFGAVTGSAAPKFALLLGLVGLLVPLAEEVLFRGVLYGWLRRWGVVLAAVASALVFGLFHGVNGLLPFTAVMGVINALAYERTGSLWPAVVAHAMNNVLSVVLLRLVQ